MLATSGKAILGLLVWGLESGSELLHGNSRLPQNTRQSAYPDLPMIGNNTARGAATHDNMTASLPHDLKTETLQSPHRL